MIEKLTFNWTAWGGLTEKERAFLRANASKVVSIDGNPISGALGDDDTAVYRLIDQDYVEVDVYLSDKGHYMYEHNHSEYYLNLPPHNFGGVLYAEDSETWYMQTALLVESNTLYAWSGPNTKRRPATPVKVRLLCNIK